MLVASLSGRQQHIDGFVKGYLFFHVVGYLQWICRVPQMQLQVKGPVIWDIISYTYKQSTNMAFNDVIYTITRTRSPDSSGGQPSPSIIP